jgi:hypothetical protein
MIKKVNGKRTKNYKKDGKELFYLDLFKVSLWRRRSIRRYFGEYLSELNALLYDLNFCAMHQFWLENKKEEPPYTEHLKNNPRWMQLQRIEKYLADEYTLINYTNKEKVVPCKDCKCCSYEKFNDSFRWFVDEKMCGEMIESRNCNNIKIIRKEL